MTYTGTDHVASMQPGAKAIRDGASGPPPTARRHRTSMRADWAQAERASVAVMGRPDVDQRSDLMGRPDCGDCSDLMGVVDGGIRSRAMGGPDGGDSLAVMGWADGGQRFDLWGARRELADS